MRNRKRISILLVLAMVMTMLTGFAAPAAASTAPFVVFSSGFTTVTTGDNRTGGTVAAVERAADSWGTEAGSIFVSVTLPEGVTFNTTPTSTNFASYVSVTGATNLVFEAAASNMLRVRVTPTAAADSVSFNFATDALSRLNVGSGVTGDIRATVDVHRIVNEAVTWIESDTRTIARVAPRAVTVTAAAPNLVQMGNNRTASRITIQEGAAASLLAGEDIRLEIVTDGVTFFNAPNVAPSSLTTSDTGLGLSDANKNFTLDVATASAVFAGRIEINSFLNVDPGVTGDIRVRVRSLTANTAIATTTVTVATIGTVAVEVTGAANTGGITYAGYPADVVDVTAGSARFNLRATGGGALPQPRIVVLALSNAKFEGVATPFVIESRVGATGAWATQTPTITRFDENRKAWFETAGWGNATELRISGIRVAADADAAAGDLRVNVSGTLGATGDVTIGTIARPLTAAGNAVNLTYPGLNQAAGSITITEAARGTMLLGNYRLELPTGVVFNDTTVRPRVRVTTGDLRVSTTVSIDGDGKFLNFTVTGTSSEASVITIDQLQYDVHRTAMEGSVNVRVRANANTNWADNNAVLATAVNARVGVAAVRTSVFTIGALSFVRDGVTTAIDAAPAIVEGRTLLPLRFAALAVGVNEDDILWDSVRRTVTLLRGDRVVQLRIGDRNMTINGVVVPLEVPASIQNGRTVLPIRAIAQALRASVVWDGTARTVTVTAQ